MTTSFDSTLLSRIEDAGINASAPPQQRWLDGWLVRFSPGKAKRARCIKPVASGRMPAEEKLAICQRLYDSVGLELTLRVTPFSQPAGIDDDLIRLGFEKLDETCVMVEDGLNERERSALAPTLPRGYRMQPLSHRALAETVGLFQGTPLAQREAHAERLQESPVPFSAFRSSIGTVSPSHAGSTPSRTNWSVSTTCSRCLLPVAPDWPAPSVGT